MKPAFFLRLPADFDPARPEPLDWFDARDDSAGKDPLAVVAQRAAGARVTAIVPAEAVLLLEAEIPGANRQRLIKAAPYALEERLAAEPESLHFAFAPGAGGGRADTAVVARERMRQWLQGLEQAGIALHSLVPASLAVPWEANAWTLLIDSQVATLRTGREAAAILPAEELETLLELSLGGTAEERRPTTVHHLRTQDSPETDAVIHRVCAAFDVEVIHGAEHPTMAHYRRGLEQGGGIELLQGEFGRADQAARLWRPWRGVAALVLLLGGVQTGLLLHEHQRLNREGARLDERIEALYRETFPETRNLVDPRLQMEQHLQRLQQRGDGRVFPTLLAEVGPVLKDIPELELLALDYQGAVLALDLRLPNFQALDALKTSLGALDGLRPEIGATTAEEGRVRTRLQLRQGGA